MWYGASPLSSRRIVSAGPCQWAPFLGDCSWTLICDDHAYCGGSLSSIAFDHLFSLGFLILTFVSAHLACRLSI